MTVSQQTSPPNESYGNTVGGAYTPPFGDTATLLSGANTITSGPTGNLYATNPAKHGYPETPCTIQWIWGRKRHSRIVLR
jgi:hypothetical protein